MGAAASIWWTTYPPNSLLPVYYQGVLQKLIAAVNFRSCQRRALRSNVDPTGNQQDCLGMTPLHILTCSSVHDMEIYCVIIENYPTILITEDRSATVVCILGSCTRWDHSVPAWKLSITLPWSYIQLDNDGGDNGEDWYTKRKHWALRTYFVWNKCISPHS